MSTASSATRRNSARAFAVQRCSVNRAEGHAMKPSTQRFAIEAHRHCDAWPRWKVSWTRLLVACTACALVAACAGSQDLVPNKEMVGVSVSAVGHYGSGIGVPEFYVNGRPMGNVSGWGGGGGGMCCVQVPRTPGKPIMVTVKWETYRSNVKEERHHEATVPIQFEISPGDGGTGLYLHFLPGHRVVAWYPRDYPESASYKGPPFPRGSAPGYTPLPGEKPQPTMQN